MRAVVLSGEGRGFCSGLDFAAFQAMAGPSPEGGGDGSRAATRLGDRAPGRITNHGQQAAFTWTELPVPVIAAVHGVALGGGLQIALAADLRIVAPDARLSVLEIRWGLIPDMTGTHMLRRLVPLDVAKELTWTGRMVSGEEAVALGLATRLADDPRGDRAGPGCRGGCRQSPCHPGREAAAQPVRPGQPGAAVPGRSPDDGHADRQSQPAGGGPGLF